MAYCTQADITKLLPSADLIQLTDDDEDDVADALVIAEGIAHADGIIDGYCQERYTVPFDTVPELIKNLSVEIAIYYFYSRRDIVQETRQRRYDAAIRMLKEIAAGTLKLGADPQESETGSSIQSTSEDRDRIFDDDTMENF